MGSNLKVTGSNLKVTHSNLWLEVSLNIREHPQIPGSQVMEFWLNGRKRKKKPFYTSHFFRMGVSGAHHVVPDLALDAHLRVAR